MIYVIGSGGVGSWIAPSLCLLKGRQNITLVDGDTLEQGNLNRQLFSADDVGRNKAEALSERYGCQHSDQWYTAQRFNHSRSDWLLVCVDNHPARKAALDACDRARCQCIMAANEQHSSEAYYYHPKWKDTRLDPRVYYPDILTDHADDPVARGIGCTGEAQVKTPQLVSSNFSAASLAQHLFVLWGMKLGELDKSVVPHLPYLMRMNMTRSEQLLVGEL